MTSVNLKRKTPGCMTLAELGGIRKMFTENANLGKYSKGIIILRIVICLKRKERVWKITLKVGKQKDER